MIGIIVPPMPRPITNSDPPSSQYEVCGSTWVNPKNPTTMSTSANGTVRPIGTRSASVPAIGMVIIAPMPCGAISRPAASVDSPRTCRK